MVAIDISLECLMRVLSDHVRRSILEVCEGVVEFPFQFQHLSVFNQLYFLQFFPKVEDVH